MSPLTCNNPPAAPQPASRVGARPPHDDLQTVGVIACVQRRGTSRRASGDPDLGRITPPNWDKILPKSLHPLDPTRFPEHFAVGWQLCSANLHPPRTGPKHPAIRSSAGRCGYPRSCGQPNSTTRRELGYTSGSERHSARAGSALRATDLSAQRMFTLAPQQITPNARGYPFACRVLPSHISREPCIRTDIRSTAGA